MTWLKRYTSFSLDEILGLSPDEFQLVCETLRDIIEAENGPKD